MSWLLFRFSSATSGGVVGNGRSLGLELHRAVIEFSTISSVGEEVLNTSSKSSGIDFMVFSIQYSLY